jgi:hypothetical protein
LAVDIANNGSSWAKSIAREYGSINAYLDMSFPMPPDHRFFLNALNTILPRFTGFYAWLNPVTFTFSTTLALALWPWLTAIAFQIFQITMRRVRVRPMHDARGDLCRRHQRQPGRAAVAADGGERRRAVARRR